MCPYSTSILKNKQYELLIMRFGNLVLTFHGTDADNEN